MPSPISLTLARILSQAPTLSLSGSLLLSYASPPYLTHDLTLPPKVAELAAEHAAYMRGEATSESHESLMAKGRALEEGREFSQAIDAYLQVSARG